MYTRQAELARHDFDLHEVHERPHLVRQLSESVLQLLANGQQVDDATRLSQSLVELHFEIGVRYVVVRDVGSNSDLDVGLDGMLDFFTLKLAHRLV